MINSANNRYSIIFDMDGVVINNFGYHLTAWETFCKNHGIIRTKKELLAEFGGKNKDIFSRMFNRQLDSDEILKLEMEKETLYRDLYRPYIQEVSGLTNLLVELKKENIQVGLATSAPTPNVDMIIDRLNLRPFFSAITDASMVINGKPDPEIFIKCAQSLQTNPAQCIVFEDSVSGILAAKAAGMKVIGVLTTHTQIELPPADYYITDFTGIDAQVLSKISQL